MKRAVAYVLVVLAWLILAFAVGLAVSVPLQLVRHSGELILWRVALLGLITIVVGLACLLMIRWARSTLGKPGGSRAGRLVFGLALILFGVGVMNTPNPDATDVGRDGTIAAGAGTASSVQRSSLRLLGGVERPDPAGGRRFLMLQRRGLNQIRNRKAAFRSRRPVHDPYR